MFSAFGLDAAHRRGNRCVLEFFHSGMAMVDGVLPVNGFDVGGVGRALFTSQGWVRVGGGRVGGTATNDFRARVLASDIRLVGSRPGTAGHMGVARSVGQICPIDPHASPTK